MSSTQDNINHECLKLPPVTIHIKRNLPSHIILFSDMSVHGTVLEGRLREDHVFRGFGDGSSSDDDEDDDNNNGEDRRGIHTTFASHHHNSNRQHSDGNTTKYESLSFVKTSHTSQTSAGTLGKKHDGSISEVATKMKPMGMNVMFSKSPAQRIPPIVGLRTELPAIALPPPIPLDLPQINVSRKLSSIGPQTVFDDGRVREVAPMDVMFSEPSAMHSSKEEHLIHDSPTKREPILLDIPNERNELVMAAYSTQSIPKLYPIVGFRKELPGIALSPPIPLDLPKINYRKPASADPRAVFDAIQKQQPVDSVNQPQQTSNSQSMDFSDPVSIISRAAEFLTAGDYGMMLKVLEILDKHLVLPEDIDMAIEFGQGLANYKNLHYRALNLVLMHYLRNQ